MTFEQVYSEHFPFVWRSLRRLGVREHDAADATQDVFVVVHRKLAGFEGRSKMTTWLFSICLHVAKDRHRNAYERRKSEGDGPLSDRPDERANVEAEVMRREGFQMLEEILDEMPIEQRAVFGLFELDQKTGDEIAELCAIPLGTVYSRLRLARASFEASLSRRGARDRFHQALAGAAR